MTSPPPYCTHDDRYRILDLGSTPLADAFPLSPDDEQPTYPLRLTICPRCLLVELEDRVPDHLLFGSDYGFFSGSSPALVRHFREYADWVRAVFGHFDAVVEVACNDGTLLKNFDDGMTLLFGVDPAGPATELARERGLNVVTQPLTTAYAETVADTLPARRLVVANNVIAHVPDLDDFLADVAILVGDDGVAVLEFQYLPDLLLTTQFDLVYHEHRRFLSLSSLLPVVEHHGLRLVNAHHVDTQGGSLRVTLVRSDRDVDAPQRWTHESWVRDLGTYDGLQARVDHVRYQLVDLINRRNAAGDRIALYGAPAKATTLLHYCDLTHGVLRYAVDLTPTKVGRYMPGTDIMIVPPDVEDTYGPADTYLLAIPNYASSVLRREREFLERGGRFIVATPRPVIL